MRLPLRQEKAHSSAENKAWHREPNSCLNSVRGHDMQDEDGPEREAHHATGREETDSQGCVRSL
jgi:hypothetical protein